MADFEETLATVRQAIDFVKQNPYPGSLLDIFLDLCYSQIKEAQRIVRNADVSSDGIKPALGNIRKVSLDIQKDQHKSIDPIKAILHGSRATINIWCTGYEL